MQILEPWIKGNKWMLTLAAAPFLQTIASPQYKVQTTVINSILIACIIDSIHDVILTSSMQNNNHTK